MTPIRTFVLASTLVCLAVGASAEVRVPAPDTAMTGAPTRFPPAEITLPDLGLLRASLPTGVAEIRRPVPGAMPLSAGPGPLPPQRTDRSWIRRHPKLFGAIVGAGAGAISSVGRWNELYCTAGDEYCLIHGGAGVAFGAGIGAGIGAIVGNYVIGR